MVGKLLSVGTVVSLALVGMAATQDPKPAAATGGVNAYQVDDVHSSALFRVHHAGAGQFWGRFNDVSGTFTLSDDPAKMAFAIDISVDSVDSGNDKLDGHLKSPDFFNSKEFPKLSFVSKSAKKAANGMFEVSGDLTMHGVTKPITAMVELTGESNMMGSRGGIEAVFTVKRSEWGMNYGVEKGMIGDSVRVVVGLEGVKAK
jgi:polyisoprenoid-binding protein YceI